MSHNAYCVTYHTRSTQDLHKIFTLAPILEVSKREVIQMETVIEVLEQRISSAQWLVAANDDVSSDVRAHREARLGALKEALEIVKACQG